MTVGESGGNGRDDAGFRVVLLADFNNGPEKFGVGD
jgi:hypothetical protein